jgi:hypothetical protein
MRYLLDKNIVRHSIIGLRDRRQRPLTELELGALAFWRAAEEGNDELFISSASFQILQRLAQQPAAQAFLDVVYILHPAKYYLRWSRRIRETTGLAREDAAMVALASFGTDERDVVLGVEWLITYDRPLINGYQNYFSRLERRLRAMKSQLQAPYSLVTLPRLSTPDEAQINLKRAVEPVRDLE